MGTVPMFLLVIQETAIEFRHHELPISICVSRPTIRTIRHTHHKDHVEVVKRQSPGCEGLEQMNPVLGTGGIE